MAELKEQTLQSLRNRQALARAVMKLLRQWNAPQDVMDHYQAQLREITAEIRQRTRAAKEAQGWVKPPPQVAKMKTARMGASAVARSPRPGPPRPSQGSRGRRLGQPLARRWEDSEGLRGRPALWSRAWRLARIDVGSLPVSGQP